MAELFRNVFDLLDRGERRRYAALIALSGFAAVVQSLGLLSIMPFIVLIANPEVLDTNLLLARAYQVVGAETELAFLALLGIFGIVALAAGNMILALEHWATHRFLCGLGHRLEKATFRNILSRPFEYHLTHHSGGLSNIVLNQVERSVDGVIGSSIAIVGNVALVMFVVALLLIIDPITTIVTLIGLVAMYLAVFSLLRRRIGTHGEALTTLSDKLFISVKESFDGVGEIATRNVVEYFVNRFDRASLPLSQLAVRFGVLNFLPNFILETLIIGGLVGVALYLLLETQNAGATLSYVALYGISAYRLIPSLKSVAEGLATIQHSADAVRAVGECSAPVVAGIVESDMPMPRSEIAVRSVTFQYSGSHAPQLHDVSVTIPIGASVCLFGPSGSGKSTLMNLLAGLIIPQHGTIHCDNVQLLPATVNRWRRHIGYCPQQVYLFDDTILSNIAFGLNADEIDVERVVTVGDLAMLGSLAQRPGSTDYGAVIGEQGRALSGGQRQRIGVARLLYPDPEILLMDEMFVGLDGRMREALQDNLFGMEGKTLVFASHDVSLAERCDQVLVIDEGRLIASGHFDQLCRDSIRFRNMLANLPASDVM